MFHYHWAVSCMIRKVSAEDIAIRGNGTGLEYMCPTRHFVYIFFNPVFQVSTAKNEINLFNNHVLIVAPVTFAPAGAMTPSAEFLLLYPLEVQSTLVISNSKGLSELLRDIRTSTYQICRSEEKLIRLTIYNKYMCNWTFEVRDILKILWKIGEIAPLFHNILHIVRFSCLSREHIFTLR